MLCNLVLIFCYTNLTSKANNARLSSIIPQITPIVIINRSVLLAFMLHHSIFVFRKIPNISTWLIEILKRILGGFYVEGILF